MPITLVTGPANSGKAQVVLDAVRGQAARGEEPLLVVPTRADVEHYLRELASDAVAMGLRVVRFKEVVEETVRRGGVAERALPGQARERLIAAVLERQQAGEYSPQLASRGLVRALARLFAELRESRVTPARLRQALAAWAAAEPAAASRAQLGRWYAEYDDALARIGRVDSELRAVRALDSLRLTPSRWGGTPVAFYGFDDLTVLQLDAIETLGRVVAAPVTVSLAYEPGRVAFGGRASTFAALQPLADEHRRLKARARYYAPRSRATLAHLERSLFEAGGSRALAGDAVRLLEGGGERAELELVAREISELLREGIAAEEIAVVLRSPGGAADLLQEVFAAAGIPCALERRWSFGDTAVGRALLGALSCVASGGAEGAPGPGSTADLLAWLRAPGMLDRPRLADDLELRARRAGAVTAPAARALWEQRNPNWQLDRLDRLGEAAARGPVGLIDAATRELLSLFTRPRRGLAAVLGEQEAEEARALSAGRAALAELRELATLAPELAPADGPALAEALSAVAVYGGRPPEPGAVAVLDPLALRARRVKVLFAASLQEGVFPSRAIVEPLLSEDERGRLAQASGLRLGERADPLAAERYLFYASLSRPEQLLVLSWHVADDDGEPTARSLFVDDVCDLFEDDLADRRLRRPLGAAEPAPAPASGMTDTIDTAGPRELVGYRLGDERVLERIRSRPWSPSSVESWIRCPMRWFVQRLLDPAAFEPEAEPLARGSLAHDALHETFLGLRERTGSARLTPRSLEPARELLGAALERGEAEHPLSVAPERLPAVRRRLRADLERYLEHAAAAESPLEPQYLELGFGIGAEDDRGEASELPALEFAPGAFLRGRIDRIDVSASGEAVVYDYKSSAKVPAPDRWASDGRPQVALYMSVAEQLLGLRVVGGFYVALSGRDMRGRGVLDADATFELTCVGGDTRAREDLEETIEAALATARTAAAEASAGELEPRPETCGFTGKRCEYPAICRCER